MRRHEISRPHLAQDFGGWGDWRGQRMAFVQKALMVEPALPSQWSLRAAADGGCITLGEKAAGVAVRSTRASEGGSAPCSARCSPRSSSAPVVAKWGGWRGQRVAFVQEALMFEPTLPSRKTLRATSDGGCTTLEEKAAGVVARSTRAAEGGHAPRSARCPRARPPRRSSRSGEVGEGSRWLSFKKR